jgi:pimeloyl-ACP methyl ester carboxylesterase
MAVEAADGYDELVVAAQSMGAFTAVPLCERRPAHRLVLLNAMIPAPGETAGDWWANTGSEQARRAAARAGGYPEEFDLETYFLHDVPPEALAGGPKHQRDEADIAFEEPCPFTRWPDIPTTVLASGPRRLLVRPEHVQATGYA